MENLAHDIENFGGEVFLIISDQIEKENHLIDAFKKSVSIEYTKLSTNIKKVIGQIVKKKIEINYLEIEKTIKGLRGSFTKIKRHDFFDSEDKIATERLLIESEEELYKLITSSEK